MGYSIEIGEGCLEKIPDSSEFAAIGHDLIALVKKKQYNDFLTCLNRLSLPEEYLLEVELANSHSSDLGDVSRLYLTPYSLEGLNTIFGVDIEYDIFKHIQVEDSYIGAWQAFLLDSLPHILPTFWHGGYITRTYILSPNDLKELTLGEEVMTAFRIGALDITPRVFRYVDSQNDRDRATKYLISYCFWTSWGGLIREIAEVSISNNKFSINKDTMKHITLYHFECGVCF